MAAILGIVDAALYFRYQIPSCPPPKLLMSSSILQFTCTHCQTPLTVPASMAGIEGPCPKCGQSIQAPQATPATAPTSFAAEPREKPKTSHAAKIPEPREKPRNKEEFADRPNIPPAPRGLPERSKERKVEPRHSTAEAQTRPQSRRQAGSSQPRSSSKDSGSVVSRFAVPMLFAVVSAATVYFLLYHFKSGGPGQTHREALGTPPGPASSLPAEGTPPTRVERPPTSPSSAPPTPPREATRSAPPQPTVTVQQGDIAKAEELLLSFFGRKTLAERLAMAEPARAAGPLEGGLLDGPLPPVGEALSGSPVRNALEDYLDIPFNIQFPIAGEAPGQTRDTLVIVRQRGDGEPKVLINPLLDLAGGSLDQFAATPVEGQHVFRAVIEAMPRCFEPGIPDADKKFTYKISSSTRQSEITRAYASRQSPLAEQLYSPDSGIGWGRRLRATIVIEWNTTEDPDNPFIEMREIKALDWSS